MSALTKISFNLLGFLKAGWFFGDFAQFWVFLYCCPMLTNDVGAKTSNAHRNSAAHTQEKNSSYSSYTAMPTARKKLLSTSWNVQFVAFNTSEKLNNNLVNV
jgi:hypothetical protein